jgi:hypothetical protein
MTRPPGSSTVPSEATRAMKTPRGMLVPSCGRKLSHTTTQLPAPSSMTLAGRSSRLTSDLMTMGSGSSSWPSAETRAATKSCVRLNWSRGRTVSQETSQLWPFQPTRGEVWLCCA